MKSKISALIILAAAMLALTAGVESTASASRGALSEQQLALARQLAGRGLRNCGAIAVRPVSDPVSDLDDGPWPLNRRAAWALRHKKPFLLAYTASGGYQFDAWFIVATRQGRITIVGYPYHDAEQNPLSTMRCSDYKIITRHGHTYLDCR